MQITRREILKAFAAGGVLGGLPLAASAPAAVVAPRLPVIDWRLFCYADDLGRRFNLPLCAGGWKMATDVRICILAPSSLPDSVGHNGAAHVLAGADVVKRACERVEEWQPWPAKEWRGCGAFPHYQRVGGACIPCGYDLRIRTLGRVEFGDLGAGEPLAFRFEGGGLGAVGTLAPFE